MPPRLRFVPRALVILAIAFAGRAGAEDAPVVLAIPARTDMVHDEARNLVYISAGDRVLRYSTKSRGFDSPLVFGGSLRAIDLSPDGRTLVAADANFRKDRAWVWLVDLESGDARMHSFQTSAYYETGTFAAVYGADGKVYTTSSCTCSGWMPLRRLDPANGSWQVLASLRDDSMLVASGDASTIAFAEVDTSDGSYGLYRIPGGTLINRQGSGNGTGRFNWEIGTNRTGTQFLLPTHGGAFVFGADYAKLAVLGASTLAKPAGVAYHPVEDEFYLPTSYNGQLQAYNAATLAPARAWPLFARYGLPSYYNIHAFIVGRTRISRDGSLLMVAVPGGVALVRQYAPLRAEPVAAEIAAGATVDLPLPGSVGNGGAVAYSLPAPPPQGSATIVGGNTLRYTAAAQGTGWVHFRYRAHYGRAVFDADVWIHVLPAARPSSKPPRARGVRAVFSR